jgi:hypothetical protein
MGFIPFRNSGRKIILQQKMLGRIFAHIMIEEWLLQQDHPRSYISSINPDLYH